MSDADSSSSSHPAQSHHAQGHLEQGHLEQGHLDPDALDELAGASPGPAAGAGTPRRAAAERAHLRACPQCASTLDGIREVRAVLAGAPVPPLPRDVGERLQEAVRAETRARQDPRGARMLPFAGGVAASRQRSWPSRVLTAAAALLVVAGAGSLLVQEASGPQAGMAESSAGGAQASANDLSGTGQDSASTEDPTGVVVLATGTDYRPQTLADQTRGLVQPGAGAGAADLGGGAEVRDAPGGGAGEQDTARPAPPATPALEEEAAALAAPASPLTQPGSLAGCLAALDVPAGATPVAVDLARYRGREVAVLVTRNPYVDAHEVWVVSRSCGPGATGLVGYALVPR